jgi:transposase-like protein
MPMTENGQNRVLAWRLKLLQEASVMPRNVAQACRHLGLSRQTFYKWEARYKSYRRGRTAAAGATTRAAGWA